MHRTWTFGRTLAAGFSVVVALNLIVVAIALISLNKVVERKDKVIETDSRLVLEVQKLLTIRDARAAANRAYLISGKQSYLDEQFVYDAQFTRKLDDIHADTDTGRGDQLIDAVAALQNRFVVLDRTPVRLRQQGASTQQWSVAWENINTQRLATTTAMNALYAYQQELVDTRKQQASSAATSDVRLIMAVAVSSVLASILVAWTLTRRLRRRIGTAVDEVRRSSADLQTTANQQAAGAKDQATAINQISTTATELLATSQQIADNAQQVSGAAHRTSNAGQHGHSTVTAAQESMEEIRSQVDAIVTHMYALTDKSARIMSVLDIVTELAEQTNILAINSSIEAAGAGESGARFGVVADEIRKLADRVAISTQHIRQLIDDVRTAVDTTATASEAGSKAVDAGAAQVKQVATSLEEIVALVQTATEASREIELSTRQQSTAVEQVTFAIDHVARNTLETETGAGETLKTATQLTVLSTKLHGLVTTGPTA